MPDAPPREMISASELDRYAYCPLSWWLERQGQEARGPELSAGEETHRRTGEVLEGARVDEVKAREFEVGVLWFAVIATILAIVGITLLPYTYSEVFARLLTVVSLIWLLAASFFLYRSETISLKEERTKYEALIMVFGMVAAILTIAAISLALIQDPMMARFLELVAVTWLIGASVLFYQSLRKRTAAARAKLSQRVDENAELRYIDTLGVGKGGQPGMLVSVKYGLQGRPDLIIVKEGKSMPVEIKTGRTPRGPLFSHILQLAAYLLLVEEAYGSAPSEGIIRYAERDDKIEWSSELKMLVIFKLEEIRGKLGSGEVHRNHNRPGKCRTCSRREGCPERLD